MNRQSFKPNLDSQSRESNQYHRIKVLMGPLLGVLLLIPALPVIGLLVVIVRLTSPGPGIFKQLRVGRNGKTFTMYKIRTMVVDAEDGLGVVWSQKGDRRVTLIGHFIRNLHLDEFPQLFNVIKGEMTLIGPRPERPEIACVLADTIQRYDSRHFIKPGITGLAQINLPPDSDLLSVRKKLYLDLKYIETANWRLDLRILLATSLRIFGLSGDWCAKLFRLHRNIPVNPLDEPLLGAECDPKINGQDSDHFVQFDHVVHQNVEQEQRLGSDQRYADSVRPSRNGSDQSTRQSPERVAIETKTVPQAKKSQASPQQRPAPRPR